MFDKFTIDQLVQLHGSLPEIGSMIDDSISGKEIGSMIDDSSENTRLIRRYIHHDDETVSIEILHVQNQAHHIELLSVGESFKTKPLQTSDDPVGNGFATIRVGYPYIFPHIMWWIHQSSAYKNMYQICKTTNTVATWGFIKSIYTCKFDGTVHYFFRVGHGDQSTDILLSSSEVRSAICASNYTPMNMELYLAIIYDQLSSTCSNLVPGSIVKFRELGKIGEIPEQEYFVKSVQYREHDHIDSRVTLLPLPIDESKKSMEIRVVMRDCVFVRSGTSSLSRPVFQKVGKYNQKLVKGKYYYIENRLMHYIGDSLFCTVRPETRSLIPYGIKYSRTGKHMQNTRGEWYTLRYFSDLEIQGIATIQESHIIKFDETTIDLLIEKHPEPNSKNRAYNIVGDLWSFCDNFPLVSIGQYNISEIAKMVQEKKEIRRKGQKRKLD